MTRDLRYAARTLRRAPGFTTTVVLTLALGIGATTSVFCAMDRLLLRQLPYPHPDHLLAVHETQTGKGFRPVSLPNLLDWRAQTTAFDGLAGFMTRSFGLRGGRGDENTPVAVIMTSLVTSDFFHVLNIEPRIGRTFSEQEEVEGKALLILSDSLWATQFGRSPDILGRKVQLNEEPYEVIGVLPADFTFPDPGIRVDAYLPMNHRDYSSRGARPLRAIARLKSGVEFSAAQAQISTAGARLAQLWPVENTQGGAAIESLDEAWKGSRRRPLLLLVSAALLLLAIVCTNVVNLILSRTMSHQREIAIRKMLGANVSHIIRNTLTEALLLAFAGGGLGVLIAFWTLRGLPLALHFAGAAQPISALSLDGTTLAFTTGLCLMLTLLCGAAPLIPRLRGGRVLVVAQVAISLILLLSAGAFLQVFVKLMNRNPGFTSEHVYYFGFGLPEARYTDRQMAEFHEKLHAQLKSIPGVEFAGAVWHLPLNGRNNTQAFQFEGAGKPRNQWSWAAYNVVDPDYFGALHIPLLRGRAFSRDQDRAGRPAAVVVNRTFERMYAVNGTVLGRRVELGFTTDLTPLTHLWEVVGVVGDTYQTGLDVAIRPQVYIPIGQSGLDGGDYVIRTTRSDPALASAIAAAVKTIDPNLERIRVRTLDDWVTASLTDRRTPAVLTGIFAAVGLLLTALGLYGTVALEIGQRRKEMVIRVALGASQGNVVRLVLSRGLVLTCAGTALGLAGFLAAGRVLETQLYEVKPLDPANALAVAAILFMSAICACLRPARQALKLQPAAVLRDS